MADEPVGLLLAAGSSERLGRPKQLVELKGTTLVRRAALLLLEHCSEVVVVTGAQASKVETALKGLPLRLVHNDDWQSGMGGSIAKGAATLGDASGVLIMLCDQWQVDSGDLSALTDSWQESPGEVIMASCNGRLSPPAIFPARLVAELEKLSGNRGAKTLLSAEPGSRTVKMPNAAFDLDTREDLQSLLNSGQRPLPA